MCKFQSAGALVGRILLSLIFLLSGLTKFSEFSKTAENPRRNPFLGTRRPLR